MAGFWVAMASVLVFVASWLALAIAAGAGWMSERATLRKKAMAFSVVALAVFWTFRGFPIVHSAFSGEAFQAETWSWLMRWKFDFSLRGWLNFFGIVVAIGAYLGVFAVLVGMTVWKIPTLDRSRPVIRYELSVFAILLALDYAWLAKVPKLLL